MAYIPSALLLEGYPYVTPEATYSTFRVCETGRRSQVSDKESAMGLCIDGGGSSLLFFLFFLLCALCPYTALSAHSTAQVACLLARKMNALDIIWSRSGFVGAPEKIPPRRNARTALLASVYAFGLCPWANLRWTILRISRHSNSRKFLFLFQVRPCRGPLDSARGP